MKYKTKSFFRWNIRTRLFIQLGAIICIFALVMMIMNAAFLEKYYISSEKKTLKKEVQIINSLNITDYRASALDLEKIEKLYNSMIVIYKPIGSSYFVVYYTNIDFTDFTTGIRDLDEFSYVSSDVLERDIESADSVYELQQDKRMPVQYMVYKVKLQNGDILDIRLVKNSVSKSVGIANQFMLYIGVGALFLSLVWALFFSKRFTRPIVEMNDITASMAGLDFTRKCRAEGKDEIAHLGQSVNNLSVSLDMALTDLKERNEKLQEDVLRERKLEEMRREFISNVSHELKTPIAIVMGYAEGLQLNVVESDEKREYYYEVIGEEARKMDMLVKELLQLSSLESGQAELVLSEFSAKTMIESVIHKYEPIFVDEGIALTSFVDEGTINADSMRIEQVLTNFINNAVYHIDDKKTIAVRGEKKTSTYRVSVYNTGKNIPFDELENIWQSFYRSDQARRHEDGRFGLGLSISRAIIETHRGMYGINNFDEGVEFWFEL